MQIFSNEHFYLSSPSASPAPPAPPDPVKTEEL